MYEALNNASRRKVCRGSDSSTKLFSVPVLGKPLPDPSQIFLREEKRSANFIRAGSSALVIEKEVSLW